MSEVTLDQVVELALKLTVEDQAKLVALVATNLLHVLEETHDQMLYETLATATRGLERWSVQIDNDSFAILKQGLDDYKQQRLSPNSD